MQNIEIFSTTFNTPDNRHVVVPNRTIYSGVITNYSAKDTRRIDLTFGIGYDDDIKKSQGDKRKDNKLGQPHSKYSVAPGRGRRARRLQR